MVKKMSNLKKQVGGALIGYLVIATATAGLAAYYGINKMKSDYEIQVIQESALKMEQMQSAQLQCYNDLRRWCSQPEMTGYYQGDNQIIGGDNITYTVDGSNLLFSVNIGEEARAQRLSQLVVSPSVTGTFVRSTIRPPTDASIYSERLQRYGNAIDSDRIIMATNLGMGGNDVNNAENVFSQTLNVETTVADTLNTNTTVVSEELNVGGNRIVSVGSDIEIYAGTVKPSGTVTLAQNMFGTSSSDMMGFTNVDGEQGDFENTTTDTLTANSGNIDTLNVDTATSDNLTATTGSISNSNISNITFGSATGNTLNTSSLNVNNSLTGGELTAANSAFGTLNSTNASINSANISDVTATSTTANTLTASSAQFVDLQAENTVSNTVNTGSVVAGTANIGALITSALSGNSGVATSTSANNITANNLSVAGTLGGETLIATSGTIGSLNASNLNATSAGTVTLADIVSANINADNLVGDNATMVNVIVNNNLISNELIANVANIALVEASSATITNGNFYRVNAANGSANTANVDSFEVVNASFNNLNASGLSANNANITNFNVDTLTATGTSNINTLNANSFSGSQFYASGDFYTGQSSVNANAGNFDALEDDMDNCINTTKYCVPSAPIVSLLCTNCSRAAFRSNFSGFATANISSCSQGCNYSWITNGPDLSFSGCTSGSIVPGGSASPTCSVSANVDPESTSSGSIRIVVTNAKNVTLEDTQISFMQYENKTSEDHFADLFAGCFIDTAAFDTSTANACDREISAPTTIVYSVGESIVFERFEFNTPADWSIVWSGDCTGTGLTCNAAVAPQLMTYTVTSVATVTHIASGDSKSYSVTGSISKSF